MQLHELLHQYTMDELLLNNILWTVETCFTGDSVFIGHNSHIRARDNPHDIRKQKYEVSVSVWARIAGNIVVSPYLLPDRLTAQQYHDFLETSSWAA
jgi:hypothetical protein